jgi:hypothetical protein
MSKYTIRPLSIILAFAGFAELAQAGDINILTNDGTYTKIYYVPTALVARSYGISQDGSNYEYIVMDCARGQGIMEVYEPITKGKTYERRFIGNLIWNKGGTTPTSQIATYICGTAIGKVSK